MRGMEASRKEGAGNDDGQAMNRQGVEGFLSRERNRDGNRNPRGKFSNGIFHPTDALRYDTEIVLVELQQQSEPFHFSWV